MIKTALQYADLGWAVFPVHYINKSGGCSCGKRDCRTPGKHPYTKLARSGFKNATTDPETIKRWFTAVPNANIAIATGRASGSLLVIDVDTKDGRFGEETWTALVDENGGYPDTLEAVTGSGGRHIYFYYPGNVQIGIGTNVLGDGVDVRADGGYVLAPPSNHVKGDYFWDTAVEFNQCTIATVPDWILDRAKGTGSGGTPRRRKRAERVIPLSPEKVTEIRSALDFINADDRDIWLRVGMALKSSEAGQQAYGLWTEWSRSSPKFDAADQRKTWDYITPEGGVGLSTIFFMAKDAGWVEPQPAVRVADTGTTEIVQRPEIEEPDGLLEPPGVLAVIRDYILEYAPRPQPLLAINAGLVLCGTVVGRKVAGKTGLRTNLYTVSVGDTASGKEFPRIAIKYICESAGIGALLAGESIASGSGIFSRLDQNRTCLFQLDEFGAMLDSLFSSQKTYHREISRNLIIAHTGALSSVKTAEYANKAEKPMYDIPHPCPLIHATTTPVDLYKALSSEQVLSGFLNRFIVVEAPKKRPELRDDVSVVDAESVPTEIIDWVLAARNIPEAAMKTGDLTGLTDSGKNPIIIDKTPDAVEMYREYRRYSESMIDRHQRDGLGHIWSRAWEHAERTGVIVACADNPVDSLIDEPVALWSINWVDYHVRRLCDAIKHRVADTDFERVSKQFLRYIKAAGERGLTDREINRQAPFTRYNIREREAVLDSLKKADQIQQYRIRTQKGRSRLAWIAVEIDAFAEDEGVVDPPERKER
jgi:hypothetical protein